MKEPRPALLGVFAYRDQLVRAVEGVRRGRFDYAVYTPTRGEWLEEVTRPEQSPVRAITLFGGIAGILSGTGLAVYTFLPWKLVVSGKPVVPYVPLVVIAFEFMVLIGVLSLFFGMLIAGRVPRLRLPEGYDPRFSKDRFGLLVHASTREARQLLLDAGAEEVRDVPG